MSFPQGMAVASALAALIISALAIAAMLRRKRFSSPLLWTSLTAVTALLAVSLAAKALAPDTGREAAQIFVDIALFLVAVFAAIAALTRAPQALIAYRTQADSQELRVTADVLAGAILKSPITVFSQDKDLKFIFTHNLPPGMNADILGKTDAEILTPDAASKTIPLKRAAIESGEIGRVEIPIPSNGRTRWYNLTVERFKDAKGEIGSVSIAHDITEIKENKEKLFELMQEVSHRSKNLLAIAQSIAQQTAIREGTVEEYVRRFSGRLKALADAQDMLIKSDWTGASLEDLLTSQLSMLPKGRRANVTISGAPVLLTSYAAQNLCLAIHELTINATEHGALCALAGRLDVHWEIKQNSGAPELCFDWLESGGPPVKAPEKPGFGCLMVETVLSKTLSASIALDFLPSGVECRVRMPVTAIVS